MFGTIRKHQTWLWAVIITITIVSFVVFFSPTQRMTNGSGRNVNYGSIDGKEISETEYVNAYHEALLRYRFTYGQWPSTGAKTAAFDEQRETYQRLFMIRKLEELNIQVDEKSVAQAARNLLTQFGQGKMVPVDVFEKQFLAPYARIDDFERFLQHDFGIQQLMAVVGTSGKLVTPQEARSLYEQSHEELATEAVFFNASNYLSSVTNPAPEAVGQFYTNQQAYYRIPERVQVSYIKFDPANFTAAINQEFTNWLELTKQRYPTVTNIENIVDDIYQQRGTNYYKVNTPEEAKQKIRDDINHDIRINVARKKANEFLSTLLSIEPPRVENFSLLAQSNALPVHVTEPFDEQEGPKEFDGGPNFAQAAFALNATNNPFSEQPLIGSNAVYVIAYNKEIPSEVPPLASIQDRVVTDYKRVEAATHARLAGARFAQMATNELAQGKSFAAISAGANVKPVSVPPFSLSTRELPMIEDHLSLNSYKNYAFGLKPGQASDFKLTPEAGLAVYIARKLPVDEAKMNTELPEFTKMVRQQREQEAFSNWFRKEAERGLRNTPLAQQRQPAAGGGGMPSEQ